MKTKQYRNKSLSTNFYTMDDKESWLEYLPIFSIFDTVWFTAHIKHWLRFLP
jgi:hypothetical protein